MSLKILQDYNRLIQSSRVYETLSETPLQRINNFSKRFNKEVYLKREDLLPIFSFKLRGAYNMIASLPASKTKNGIIAASAGNHAQGVAMSAEQLGIKATIVMPVSTPETKVKSVRSYNANLILKGDTFDEAFQHTQSLIKENSYTYIPPFNDPQIIAGQGTIGAEIIRQQQQRVDAVFVPVGGGGLIAGIGAYIKYVNPKVKIIGVEPEDAASMTIALKNKRVTTLPHVGIFADGVAVNRVGSECFKLARQCIDGMITVTTDEICAATKDIFEDTRVLAEPAGAVALAGVRKYCENGSDWRGLDGLNGINEQQRSKTGGRVGSKAASKSNSASSSSSTEHLVAILSGANTDFDRLRHIAERTDIGEQREGLFAVTIPEKPGSFRRFCSLLHKYNITEFNYRYSHSAQAHIFVGVRIKSRDDIDQILDKLRKINFPAYDMTSNEMAKLHIRYMVGGIPPTPPENEIIFRFEFPERPGALLHFLQKLNPKWNISLFNYRNHGAAYGRVLAGMQVPANERNMLYRYLKDLGFTFYPETDNEAYNIFLRSIS